MKYRRRIYYSAEQRAEIWDRWQRGESMSSIGRVFDRQSSSVFSVISPTGGIRPADRKRGKQALSLGEREEISRGLSVNHSFRAIARQLGRSPSTISREVRRNGGSVMQKTGRWQNFRAENLHLPFQRRERAMLRFRWRRNLQKFVAIYSSIHNHFNQKCYFCLLDNFNFNRSAALSEWR